MFYHVKDLQYNAKPACPNPVYAKKLQEVLGGQYGEITVMMQYHDTDKSCIMFPFFTKSV